MSGSILRHSHGFQVDHIGLGVPDTRAGAAWLEEQTGAQVYLRDPHPGNWFWSAALPIGENSFLEVIGPNPDWPKFQPIRALLSELERPTLLFWYVGVEDFQAFVEQAATTGTKIGNREEANLDNAAPQAPQYRRGLVGPGFSTVRPNVIEWVRRSELLDQATSVCRLTGFELSDPNAAQINATFAKLGIEVPVAQGPSRIAVSLDTPKGEWRLENPGMQMKMPGMLWQMAGLWWRSRRT